MEDSLRITYRGMAGTNHSWSVTVQNLCRAFIKAGHKITIITTNGDSRLPDDLSPYVKTNSSPKASDIDFTYTMPSNYKSRLRGHCNLGIYNYESSDLPPIQRDGIAYCDFLLPSSQFCYNIFVNAGIPKEKLRVVPHGVDTNFFNPTIQPLTSLRNTKSFRFLCVAIPHARKNLDGLIEAYATAFTKQDDVCLVLKTRVLRQVGRMFDVNVVEIINKIKAAIGPERFPAIEIVDGSIDNVASLYNACHCFVSMTRSEGFGLPFLEAMACNMPVIAPNFSGQADFLNDKNSLLIDTKYIYAPKSAQYWGYSPTALTGDPDVKHCAKLMRQAYDNRDGTLNQLKNGMENTVQQYTWDNAAKIMADLYYEKMLSKKEHKGT